MVYIWFCMWRDGDSTWTADRNAPSRHEKVQMKMKIFCKFFSLSLSMQRKKKFTKHITRGK